MEYNFATVVFYIVVIDGSRDTLWEVLDATQVLRQAIMYEFDCGWHQRLYRTVAIYS